MSTFGAQGNKGASLAQQRRRRSNDEIVRTGGFRKGCTVFHYDEPTFKRSLSFMEKYSPCASNASVDPYVVVTAYRGPAGEQQFNTEWIDDIEKNDSCFQMDETQNNVMPFDLPDDFQKRTHGTQAVSLQIMVCDHDWGTDDDDFIGKVDLTAADLYKFAKDGNNRQLVELKNKEGFSAGDIVFNVAFDENSNKGFKRMTLTIIEGIDIVNPDATTNVAQAVSLVKTVGLAGVLVLFYFVVSALVYGSVEDWTVLDSVYFAVATFTTVGYGDMGPLQPNGKLFTCALAIWGIAIISVSVGLLMGYIMAKTEQQKDKLMEKLKDADMDPSAIYTSFRGKKGEKKKPNLTQFEQLMVDEDKKEIGKVWGGIVKLVLVLGTGTIVFRYIEKENTAFDDIVTNAEIDYNGMFSDEARIWIESFYWATITAATVGYGDVYPETENGKIFAVFFIFVGTVLTAQVVALPTDIYLGRRRRAGMKQVMTTKIDRVMFERMDKDGSGDLSKLEYLKEMLVNLRLVDVPVMNALLGQFDALDADNSGTLTKTDLLDHLRAQKLKAQDDADAEAE